MHCSVVDKTMLMEVIDPLLAPPGMEMERGEPYGSDLSSTFHAEVLVPLMLIF